MKTLHTKGDKFPILMAVLNLQGGVYVNGPSGGYIYINNAGIASSPVGTSLENVLKAHPKFTPIYAGDTLTLEF